VLGFYIKKNFVCSPYATVAHWPPALPPPPQLVSTYLQPGMWALTYMLVGTHLQPGE